MAASSGTDQNTGVLPTAATVWRGGSNGVSLQQLPHSAHQSAAVECNTAAQLLSGIALHPSVNLKNNGIVRLWVR